MTSAAGLLYFEDETQFALQLAHDAGLTAAMIQRLLNSSNAVRQLTQESSQLAYETLTAA